MNDGKVPIGFPMGFKFNVEDNIDIDKLLQISEVYHANKYVIGRDDNYCEKPHYHIHFFSAKLTSPGAMKVFRSNVIKKTFPHINKSFRFYLGQDLQSANSDFWLAYAIKETQIKVSGHSITDEMLISAKSHLQIKQMKQVKSESEKNKVKEKKEQKELLLKYVKENLDNYVPPSGKEITTESKILLLIMRYFKENEKHGSLRKGILDMYVVMCLDKILGYDEEMLMLYIYNK